MSAKIRSRVTAERRLRAARTMLPLFKEEHGSSANSLAAMLIASPEMIYKGYNSVLHDSDIQNISGILGVSTRSSILLYFSDWAQRFLPWPPLHFFILVFSHHVTIYKARKMQSVRVNDYSMDSQWPKFESQ
jgi:hypothetical protein